ncbi:MAG: CoA-binding protein [Dehalococcoidales bacterium]|nr:CoA-binding protein [Dehalococcoidales bacterium]
MRADFTKLDRAFNPRCVVVVGDSGMYMWLRGLSNFKGSKYSVQVNEQTGKDIEEKLKIKNYKSVLEVPEAIDLAIVSVNRKYAMSVLDDLIKKGAAAAHFFTSGYSETNTEEGRQYEKELKAKAEAANFHIIGPNCMGLYNPRVAIKQSGGQYDDSWGPVGFISQSGTHAINFSLEAHLQGVDVAKSVSFGNGIILDSAEFLDYLGQDKEIKIIGMYLEGLRDGRRFMEVLKKVAKIKPVVIWKGGRTASGARAIASHTGSLAVPYAIWEDAIKQFGGIPVKNMDEMVDTIKALLYVEPVKGNRVGLTGGSGGQSVAITDAFTEAGIDVPPFTKKTIDELNTFYNVIGGGMTNPIDTGNSNRVQLNRIMDIVEADENIDNVVLLVGLGMGSAGANGQDTVPGGVGAVTALRKRSRKPVLAVVYSPFSSGGVSEARKTIKALQEGGVPAFSTLERAAKALKNTMEYYQARK